LGSLPLVIAKRHKLLQGQRIHSTLAAEV